MTDEQRIELRAALKAVHDLVHGLYPKGAAQNEEAATAAKSLRDRLLVIDLAMHLADEVGAAAEPDKPMLAERTANLLYAVRLVLPEYPLAEAAGLLLAPRADSD